MLFYSKNDACLTVRPTGEIDHHSVSRLREEIDRFLHEKRVQRLVFDLSDVDFMDSSGIGLIFGRYKQLAPRGGSIGIQGVSPAVERILNMSGIYQIVEKLV